jgi:hypothetical protein
MRRWNLSSSCIAGKSSKMNQNGMTSFWSSTTTQQGQGEVLHKEMQREVMIIACLLDQKEEIV